MRPMPKALITVGSLLAAGMWVAPAEAAPAGPVVIRSCSTTSHGVKLRVKMRFEMKSASDPDRVRLLRVRVSHPDGTGAFKNPRVRSVTAGLFFESPSSDPRLGSAVWAERGRNRPVYRTVQNRDVANATAIVSFRLPHGNHAVVRCTQEFPA
jgi:hypothetical protein